MTKLPSFQFYPGDWLKEAALRRCSKAAIGVWIDMICLSFECEERGVFQTAGEPWPDRDIAAAVGGDIAENLRALSELLSKGVCSRSQAGAVLCRRVVRDEQKRRLCSEAGKRGGGNPELTYKGHPKGHPKGGVKGHPKGVPKASSSSSSSTSNLPSEDNTSSVDADRIYEAYPRKISRGAAIKAIEKAMLAESPDILLEAVMAYAKSRIGKDPNYTPHAATWFNAERWKDDRADWNRPEQNGFHGGPKRPPFAGGESDLDRFDDHDQGTPGCGGAE